MTTEIKMPALTPTMEEGLLARWLVVPGATVKQGEVIAEIETEKATMEFEAGEAGVVDRILVSEGREVAVGTVIATLRSPGEPAAVSEVAAPSPATPVTVPSATPITRPAVTVQAEAVISEGPSLKPALSGDPNVNATPLARRLAQARGINLSGILGSGPRGKIVKNDVIPRAVKREIEIAATPKMAPPTIPHEVIKLTSMRRTIARRLAESKTTVPHFYISCDMRLDALLTLRAEINHGAKDDAKISVTDLLLKALANALTLVPDANVQFADDVLYKFNRVDIAMAVAIEGGLVTPVIADAGAKSLSRISREAKALALRAREGRLRPEEYQGGTASLSNLGMFGVSEIVPVLNPPQAMIIGVGAGERKPIVVDDSIVAGTVLRATGSFDHRAIDGALAAQLMQALRSVIEAPLKIVV